MVGSGCARMPRTGADTRRRSRRCSRTHRFETARAIMSPREFRTTPRRRERPFWYLRRRPNELQAEVDEELRAHLEMRIEELVATGMSPDTARREALRRFGDWEYT